MEIATRCGTSLDNLARVFQEGNAKAGRGIRDWLKYELDEVEDDFMRAIIGHVLEWDQPDPDSGARGRDHAAARALILYEMWAEGETIDD